MDNAKYRNDTRFHKSKLDIFIYYCGIFFHFCTYDSMVWKNWIPRMIYFVYAGYTGDHHHVLFAVVDKLFWLMSESGRKLLPLSDRGVG